MAQVTLPYNLTPGTPENVNNLMSNLNALKDGVNTIDTAQIAAGAVTDAKLATALANNLGITNGGNTKRATTGLLTTERTLTTSVTDNFTDVTGASVTLNMPSSGIVALSVAAETRTGSGVAVLCRVVAGDITLAHYVASDDDTSYVKSQYAILVDAGSAGSGNKTVKLQFCPQNFGFSHTAYIKNVNLSGVVFSI